MSEWMNEWMNEIFTWQELVLANLFLEHFAGVYFCWWDR